MMCDSKPLHTCTGLNYSFILNLVYGLKIGNLVGTKGSQKCFPVVGRYIRQVHRRWTGIHVDSAVHCYRTHGRQFFPSSVSMFSPLPESIFNEVVEER